MINTKFILEASQSDEKLTEAFPPSNMEYKDKVKKLHALRGRIINKEGALQGLLTFVPSSVVPDDHPMFEQVAYTDGDVMFFADRFFSMETPVQCAVILHEMFHIVFRHVSRGYKRIGSLYNIAADAIINQSIGFQNEDSQSISYAYLPKKDVVSLDSLYEIYEIPSTEQRHFSQWTTESLYEFLIKKIKEKLEKEVEEQEKNKEGEEKEEKGNKKSKSSKNKQSGNSNGSSPSAGSSSSNNKGKGSSQSELEKIEKEIEDLQRKLAKKHKLLDGSDCKEGDKGKGEPNQIDDFKWTQRYNRAKSQSNNSKNSILGRVNPDVYQPQIPWQVELRKFLVKRCMPLRETSWSRPARRMASVSSNTYLPGLEPKKGIDKMSVIIDTSGSCFNEEELTMFCTEIQSIQSQTNVEIALIFADTEVREEVIVKADGTDLLEKIKKGWIKPAGGGGTDMVVPILHAIKKYNPILLVVASDGMTPFPTAAQIKRTSVIWVINTTCEIPKEAGRALYINPK